MKTGKLTLKDQDRDKETPEDNVVNTEKQRGNRVGKKNHNYTKTKDAELKFCPGITLT